MLRLYIGPSRDAARMESVCGFRPVRDYVCHVRLDSRRRMLGHVLAIRRSIWYVLLYFSGPAEGHMYDHELIYLCLCDEAGRAGVHLEFPICPVHVVVSQLHCAMVVCVPPPRR